MTEEPDVVRVFNYASQPFVEGQFASGRSLVQYSDGTERDGTWSGTYDGARDSEGELYHYFRDGELNGTKQGLHGFPASQMTIQVPFGANRYILPGLKAAWGCRLIVRQDGDIDFVPDRQGAAGDEVLVDKTTAWVNEKFDKAKKTLAAALRDHVIDTRKDSPTWVYEDERGIMVGNTNASAGYFYLVAWLFEALPDGCTTKGADVLVEDIQRLRNEGVSVF